MSRLLTCPQGHQWQSPLKEHAGSTEVQIVCPICGTFVEVAAEVEEGDLVETVEHISNPVAGSEATDPIEAIDPVRVTIPYLTPGTIPSLPAASESRETTDALASAAAPEDAPAVPRTSTVAGYEILGELGRGGMGVVYKARQSKLHRLVALKMILAGAHAGKRQFERFRIEAEAVARLQHPNIVQIYEIGEQDGLPFFSLEFVDGGTLSKKLAGTPLPARQAAELTATLARAVDAAHRRNILHRDLKPANILLTNDGVPKITDFGLAKKLDDTEGQTHSGAIMGTPSYMSPEQARGEARYVGPAADIYALGAILYEMLIGRPPFKAASMVDTLVQVRTQEPVAPRQLLSNLPRDLETICLKCLEKDPARRYATAGELSDDLGRFLAGEPIRARPTPMWERAWKWAKRRPALSAMTALAAGTAVLGFALVTWQWQRAEDLRDKAEKLAQTESEAKQEIKTQKDAADQARRNAQRTATRLLLERGVSLCQQRDYGPGLLWLQRGLETVPDDAPDLQQALRTLLGGWGAELCRQTIHLEHPERVLSAALSADGKKIVTGGWDRTARLWDAATGRPLGQPLSHETPVWGVAFSSDGQTVLTVSGDTTVRLWRVDTGALRGQLPRHPNRVHAAVFSPDGQRVLTGCRDKNARLWDLATGRLVGPLMAHDNEVVAVAFSPDGKRLATGSRDRTARLWETGTSKALGPPLKHPNEVRAVALGPDGTSVLTGCLDRKARVWNGVTGQLAGEPLPHQRPVSAVAFRSDGLILLTGSEDNTCRLWDRATGRRLGQPIRHQGEVSAAVFGPGGRTILTAGLDGTARLFEASGSRPRHESRWHPGTIESAAFSPDGQTILTTGADRTARLWDAATGQPRGEPMRHAGAIFAGLFSPDGTLVLTRSGDTVQLWDAATGKRRGDPLRHAGVINTAVFSPDGRFLLTGGLDQMARLWQTDTGRLRGRPFEHQGMVTFVAFSPDGKFLVSTSADGTARLRQTASGEPWKDPLAQGEPIVAAAFSPNGEVLLTRGAMTVRFWEVATGKPLGQTVRHTQVISCAVFCPDSKVAVTAGFDKSAQLVEVTTGKPVCAPLGHQDPVLDAVFSADGRALATRSIKEVRLWRANTGEPIGESLRHGEVVSALAFRPDSQLLLTGSEDGLARWWDVTTSQPAGEAFPHQEPITALAVHPDGRTLLVAGQKGLVRLWSLPAPVAGGPERIQHWLWANTGLQLDPGGAAVPLDASAWQRSWRAIQE
jgi:WD40 repeat protein/tRNA A-37 threonylcarbamoyl transferase component Bud32